MMAAQRSRTSSADDGSSRTVRMRQFPQQQIGIPGAALHVLDALPRLFLAKPGREFRVLCRGLANRPFGDPLDGVRVVQKGEADHDEFAG